MVLSGDNIATVKESPSAKSARPNVTKRDMRANFLG